LCSYARRVLKKYKTLSYNKRFMCRSDGRDHSTELLVSIITEGCDKMPRRRGMLLGVVKEFLVLSEIPIVLFFIS